MYQSGDAERIITAAIERHAEGGVVALARAIIDELEQAGFEIRRRPEIAPTRPYR